MGKATKKKITELDVERKRREKKEVREGAPADVTNQQLWDILNYGTPNIPDSNPYHKIMSSREISPRLLALCEQLIPKVRVAQEVLNATKKRLAEAHSRLDGDKKPIMLPNEQIVEEQIVEHFSKLENNDKSNVTRVIQRDEMEKVRKDVEARLPRKFWRYDIIDQVTFEDAFQEVLGQKADFGGMRKIVVTKDDIPDHKFFNAFERAILSPLFEFDDLKGVV